ncbi:hypothetical protein LUZ60_001977 [Juncus effusus]|nr:hypothetical protein LUZ60_001977 [Juncus effusus]
MVFLFLQNPTKDSNSNDTTNSKEKLSLIQRTESILNSVIKTGARQEARLWLCGAISAIHSINKSDQLEIFLSLLEKKGSQKDVAVQLINMIFQKSPDKVGRIIVKRPSILEKFFQGNPNRILNWFDNFALTSESGHKKGSRALAQFAFSNRDSYWEELEWQGNRGNTPAVVAIKPHYFQTLDVVRTVQNFLEFVPDFWSSAELADSVRDGEILQVDPDFFVNWFLELMFEERDREVWDLVEGFLERERFCDVSKSLICLLDDERLLGFVRNLGRFLKLDLECEDLKFESCWFEILVLKNREFELDFEQILVLVSVIGKPRQVLRLICEEENQEELRNLEGILVNLIEANNLALTNELMEMEREEAIKSIAIQSWILFYVLSKECKSPKDFESVFERNEIEFRKKKFEFEFVGSDDSDSERFERKSRKKRKKNKKKRRKKSEFEFEFDEQNDDELFEFESSNRGLESKSTSWYLSTDGFSNAWNIADVPEHLAMHYFKTSMKHVIFQK